jgi:MOSC domain-containing protein YiiM
MDLRDCGQEIDPTRGSLVGLLSVNVGEPEMIGTRRGRPVSSGIRKRPVDVNTETIRLEVLNLAGDRHADRRVHGGVDKAVYAYPAEHLPRWNEELEIDPELGPGAFGENLTTTNCREDDVHVGDIWSWGDAVLRVTQPRGPCYKLAMALGRPDIVRRFMETGRTGWYLRVLRPGIVPVAGPIFVAERRPEAPTILEVHRRLG